MPWCAGELDHLCSLRPNDKAICLILGYQESLAGLNFTVAHNQGSALDIIYTVVRMTMQRRSQAGAPLNHRYVQPTQSEVERNAFHKWRCQATHFQKCRSICGVVTANIYMSRSEEHTSELQSLMRISYAVFCLKKKTTT